MDKIEVFYDNLDVISDQPILVETTIHLLPTEEGGRHTPITKNFRPNHNFGNEENRNFFIGQVELKDNEFMFPGETRDLVVTFMNVRGLKELLTIGNEWRIQEGSHLIGTAKVKFVVN